MPDDLNFDPDSFTKLSLAQRVQLCHRLAERARGLAERAEPRHREVYVEIAKQWLILARDMGRK